MIHISQRTYRLGRVIVALALLFSVSGPLLQFACGETGEALNTSALAVMTEDTSTDVAPCETFSEGLHDRLCTDVESVPVCEEDACTTDTVEAPVARTDLPQVRGTLFFTPNVFPVEGEGLALRLNFYSAPTSGVEWATRELNHVPVRLRTLSLLL